MDARACWGHGFGRGWAIAGPRYYCLMLRKVLFGVVLVSLLLVGCETLEAPGGNKPGGDDNGR